MTTSTATKLVLALLLAVALTSQSGTVDAQRPVGCAGPDKTLQKNTQWGVDLVITTPLGRESFFDDRAVRRAAMMHQVPCITTLTGAAAAVSAIRAMREQGVDIRALQDYYAGIAAG